MTANTPQRVDGERLTELVRNADPRNSESLIQLLAATIHDVPALLQQVAELQAAHDAVREFSSKMTIKSHQQGLKLAEQAAEIERLRRECELRKHAVDRWVPCPDHRDKTDGRCQVCAREAAERARDEAIRTIADNAGWVRDDGRTYLSIRVADGADLSCKALRRDALAAFLAANGGDRAP